MARVIINKDKCKGCLLCVVFCPKRIIKQDEKLNALGIKPAEIKDNSRCAGCAQCAVICPDCCIEIYK